MPQLGRQQWQNEIAILGSTIVVGIMTAKSVTNVATLLSVLYGKAMARISLKATVATRSSEQS